MPEPAANPAGYRVLARKYRPKTFADLIGQDALVRTLTNAFSSGRIAQAYMLTGVRGVGKTTTARLIARALNYPSGPTVDMPEMTPQCEAILESRHIDVIEMDAASNTGVDNVREIIDSVRYAPVEVRTKVYIIDEVHMLSKSAFNALLKTLEEPPPHVKFVFATTEIRKVPVTILSRCQRFDLKRLDAGLLTEHYGNIAKLEHVEAETEALQMIARAAEGSVRDGLSLLDQAIAFGEGKVRASDVAGMLGLSDRTRIITLFEHIAAGQCAEALNNLQQQYQAGGDPETLLVDLAEFTHWVTRLKVAKDLALRDASKSGEEKTQGAELAANLSIPVLTRFWQMLLKGITETAQAHDPLQAAEMVIIRLCHASSLPSGEELARVVGEAKVAAPRPATAKIESFRREIQTQEPNAAGNLAVAVRDSSNVAAPPVNQPVASLADILVLVKDKRDIKLQNEIERFVRPVRIAQGKLEIALEAGAPQGLANELKRKLDAWTGLNWMVSLSREQGAETVASARKVLQDKSMRAALDHPVVKAVLGKFPHARVTNVTDFETPIRDADTPDEESV